MVGPLAERERTRVTLWPCAARQRRAASSIWADGVIVQTSREVPPQAGASRLKYMYMYMYM